MIRKEWWGRGVSILPLFRVHFLSEKKISLWLYWRIKWCGAFIRSGNHNKIPQAGWPKQQIFILSQLWRLKVWNQGVDRDWLLSQGLSPWLADSCLPPVLLRSSLFVCLYPNHLLRTPIILDQGPIIWLHFTLISCLKGLHPENSHITKYWFRTSNTWNFKRTQLSPEQGETYSIFTYSMNTEYHSFSLFWWPCNCTQNWYNLRHMVLKNKRERK